MIHIFDVDYTVINKPSIWYFLREALAEQVIRFSQIRRLPIDWLKYKMGRPDMDFIENSVQHIAGIEQQLFEKIAVSCFERRIQPNIYRGAAEIIQAAQARGEQVVFASSSFDIVLAPLARFLKVNETIASSLEFSEGKTTGKVAGQSFFGLRKKIAVEQWLIRRGIDRAELRCYSDSYTDIPLLEFCGQAAAVNPDRFLVREAKKRGWEILRFRDRLGNKRPSNLLW